MRSWLRSGSRLLAQLLFLSRSKAHLSPGTVRCQDFSPADSTLARFLHKRLPKKSIAVIFGGFRHDSRSGLWHGSQAKLLAQDGVQRPDVPFLPRRVQASV